MQTVNSIWLGLDPKLAHQAVHFLGKEWINKINQMKKVLATTDKKTMMILVLIWSQKILDNKICFNTELRWEW
jgi:hypothetical protein